MQTLLNIETYQDLRLRAAQLVHTLEHTGNQNLHIPRIAHRAIIPRKVRWIALLCKTAAIVIVIKVKVT